MINSEWSELGEWRKLGEWSKLDERSELCEVNRISRVSLAQGIERGVVLEEFSGHCMCHT